MEATATSKHVVYGGLKITLLKNLEINLYNKTSYSMVTKACVPCYHSQASLMLKV